jgi:hypothetical protein
MELHQRSHHRQQRHHGLRPELVRSLGFDNTLWLSQIVLVLGSSTLWNTGGATCARHARSTGSSRLLAGCDWSSIDHQHR